ncbi:MAG: putative redox protein [Bacteroidia bacterium]|jgi:putative redox protein
MSEGNNIETFRSNAHGRGWPTKVVIPDTEWSIQVDENEEDGGTNSGPNPMQYFSAALGSCQNEQAQVVAEELSLGIDSIDISIEIDLDLSGFMGETDHSNGSYKQVRLSAKVTGDVTEDQVITLGNKVDSRCPILGLLRSSGCDIVSKWGVS